MNIIISGITPVNKTLSIIDPKTGIDYIQDFIGNTGALIDGQFNYDDQDVYICDQNTFDWWCKVASDNQILENRIYELTKEHGSEAVYAVIYDAGTNDLEDHAAYVNQALDQAFGE